MNKKKTNKVTLIVFGVIAAVIVVVGVGSLIADRKDAPLETADQQQASTQQLADQEVQSGIEVTSTIVKKLPDDTYDYWFSIKNTGDTTFTDDVTIRIWNNDQTAYAGGSGTFGHVSIDPGMTKAVSVNIEGAPASQDGDYGYFSYDKDETKQQLIEKYEDASASL